MHSKLPRYPAYDKHALRIGRISMAWNTLHEHFFWMFQEIVGKGDDGKLAYRIWHSVQNDTAQRAFLKGAIGTTGQPRFVRSVDWLMKQAEKIALERNALIHAVVRLIGPDDKRVQLYASHTSREAHLMQLATKSAPDWDRVERNLVVMANYASTVWFRHFIEPSLGLQRRPWPKRPRLLGLAGTTKPRAPRRKRKTPTRKRPPPSSRA
jgi:hypothetical protein